MTLPDQLIPALLRLGKANAAYVTEIGAYAQLHKRTLRPQAYGPPRRLRADVAISPARSAAGWPLYSVAPRNAGARGSVVYVHGGGWVNGIAPQHWQLIAQIAAEAKTTVQVVIYPLIIGLSKIGLFATLPGIVVVHTARALRDGTGSRRRRH